MQIKIKSSSVCLLLIFLSAFYQLPVVKFNLTFVSLTLLPFFAFVCWYKRLAIKVGFVFVISLMLYLVFVTLYFGWEGGSYSIINIAFYLSTLFLLRVSVQYYSFGTCFVAFYFGSLLFYTYELISRFYNVFYEESVLVSSFYVLKMNGTVFNDTNVVGLNVLFLFIMSMSFARSSAGALNHQLNSFYFRLSQLYLFILIILTFSRAAIIIAFAYCFYLFILRVNLVFKFIFLVGAFFAMFFIVNIISEDTSFLSRFSIVNNFVVFIYNMGFTEFLFGVGVLSWTSIYQIIGLDLSRFDFVGHLFFFQMLAFGGVVFLINFLFILIFHSNSKSGLLLFCVYLLLGLSYIELFSYMFWGMLAFCSIYSSCYFYRSNINECIL